MPPSTVVCGEVGLAGEVRAVGQIEMRLNEAARLGFSRFILPRSNSDRLKTTKKKGMKVESVGSITQLLDLLY